MSNKRRFLHTFINKLKSCEACALITFLYLCGFIRLSFIYDSLFTLFPINEHNFESLKVDNEENEKWHWISYGSYAAIPYFFIKKGKINPIKNELITLTSICDISSLHLIKQLSVNYKSGPISIAIFIDTDYRIIKKSEIYFRIESYLSDIDIFYDLSIAILALDTNSTFYRWQYELRSFDHLTPLSFKFPTNILRNLAEYQCKTEWIFMIDIDFIYFSKSFHETNNLKKIIENFSNSQQHSLFIVPSFEIIKSEKFDSFTSMSRKDLKKFIKMDKIEPFHKNLQAQTCTKYDFWYDAMSNYKLRDCTDWGYEPWYIMRRNVSILPKFAWDNLYIGRGLNKVERFYRLKNEFGFDLIVMSDLFMIHALNEDAKHYEPVSHKEKIAYRKYNFDKFKAERWGKKPVEWHVIVWSMIVVFVAIVSLFMLHSDGKLKKNMIIAKKI